MTPHIIISKLFPFENMFLQSWRKDSLELAHSEEVWGLGLPRNGFAKDPAHLKFMVLMMSFGSVQSHGM